MKLFEYQAKKILAEYKINVPAGELAQTPDEAYGIAEKFGARTAVKAQVLTGGRGKAGGVKLASNAAESRSAAAAILGMEIKGEKVKNVLVTPAVDIVKEFYAAVTVDFGSKSIECIISSEGGVEIEETALASPGKIHRIPLSPELFSGDNPMPGMFSEIAGPGLAFELLGVVKKMYNAFTENDCSLLEINPLAVDAYGSLIAVDAKIVIDDNSLYKHPNLEAMKNDEEYSPDERRAHAAGLAFVSLDGNIGCMVNGAGLAMATMDLCRYFGGEPANFLDIGGSSNPQKVVDGLKILSGNKNVKAILINIFGGITRCDDIAMGLIEAEKEFRIEIPLVIRLIGTNDREGIEILKANGFTAFSNLTDSVKEVVKKTQAAV